MTTENRDKFRCAVVSVVKHGYVPRGVAAHPRFELVVVTDDADQPDWVHERNQAFADEFDIPYVKDVQQALQDYDVQVAVVSSEAERHCDLSIRAAEAGMHVVQDKPMSTSIAECDRLVAAIEQSGVKFLMWNRNYLPALLHARNAIEEGQIGQPYAIHVDFYFAKDSGPPKGSRADGEPVTSWLDHQIAAHVTGADGGVGREAMMMRLAVSNCKNERKQLEFLEECWKRGLEDDGNEVVNEKMRNVVYLAPVPWTGGAYIGQTSRTFKVRVQQHLAKALKGQKGKRQHGCP